MRFRHRIRHWSGSNAYVANDVPVFFHCCVWFGSGLYFLPRCAMLRLLEIRIVAHRLFVLSFWHCAAGSRLFLSRLLVMPAIRPCGVIRRTAKWLLMFSLTFIVPVFYWESGLCVNCTICCDWSFISIYAWPKSLLAASAWKQETFEVRMQAWQKVVDVTGNTFGKEISN